MLLHKVELYIRTCCLLQKGDRVLVAVSGGPDSLCLLHILWRLAPRLDLALVVAHLDHGFRPEAGQEAEAVRRLAAAWALPFEGAAVNVPQFMAGRKFSVQEAARIVRYRFLLEAAQKHGAGKIAVGHHRDDQAETVLLHILRGAGPDGLAGMPPRRMLGGFELIRPLLDVTRREIERYCLETGLKPALDASNLKTGYTRNRIRLELLPYLEQNYNPRIKESLARLAVLAAADRAFLQEAAQKKYRELARHTGGKVVVKRRALAGLPEALQGRVARRALEHCLPGKLIGSKQVWQLLALARGSAAREIALPGGARIYCTYGSLVVSPSALQKQDALTPRPLEIPGETMITGGRQSITARLDVPAALTWPPGPRQAYLDYDTLPGPPVLRSRWSGARFHPQGAPGAKKLKDFFIDQKVPSYKREKYPLVTTGDEIVWVAGMRIGHPYRVTAKTERVLVLELRSKKG